MRSGITEAFNRRRSVILYHFRHRVFRSPDMNDVADLPGPIWSRMNVRLDRNREVTIELLW